MKGFDEAIHDGELEMVKLTLNHKINQLVEKVINSTDDSIADTTILVAIKHNWVDIVTYLLSEEVNDKFIQASEGLLEQNLWVDSAISCVLERESSCVLEGEMSDQMLLVVLRNPLIQRRIGEGYPTMALELMDRVNPRKNVEMIILLYRCYLLAAQKRPSIANMLPQHTALESLKHLPNDQIYNQIQKILF